MSVRVILLSDIHGNLPALKAVIGSLPPHDAVVVAGDLCLPGPSSPQVLDLLTELGWALLMGNTDHRLVSPPAKLGKKEQALLDWNRAQLGSQRLQRLAALPFALRVTCSADRARVEPVDLPSPLTPEASMTHAEGSRDAGITLVHANPLNMEDALRPGMTDEEVRPYLANVRDSILAFGHLHTPYVRTVDGILLVDVASAGHPKDRDHRACYAVATFAGSGWSIRQERVEYDLEETVRLTYASGMPRPEVHEASLRKASY